MWKTTWIFEKYGVCRICFRELAYKAKSLELEKQVGSAIFMKGGS